MHPREVEAGERPERGRHPPRDGSIIMQGLAEERRKRRCRQGEGRKGGCLEQLWVCFFGGGEKKEVREAKPDAAPRPPVSEPNINIYIYIFFFCSPKEVTVPQKNLKNKEG
jgi:hypothetical protein